MSLVLALAAAIMPGFADLDAIDRSVAGFTSAAIGADGGAVQPLDRRLRLRPCAASLALSWRTPVHEAVLVQCPDAGSWRLIVPVQQAPGSPATVAAPEIIRGDTVTVQVSGDGFSVSRSGEALESGAAGGWIKIRIDQAAQPLRAQVVRPGLVTIPVP